MIWQDAVLTGGGFILFVSLLPLLKRACPAPPLTTAVMLALVLWAYVVAIASLGLYWSAAATGLQACVWSWLTVKSWRAG